MAVVRQALRVSRLQSAEFLGSVLPLLCVPCLAWSKPEAPRRRPYTQALHGLIYASWMRVRKFLECLFRIMALSSIAHRIRNYAGTTNSISKNEDGSAARVRGRPCRGTEPHGRALLATTDETRATAAKRELAVLAEAFQRYDGRAQRPWTRSCQISTRDMREPKKTRIPPGDASGALDRYEIERALEDLKIPHDEVFVDDLFKALDKNKDGTVELRSGSTICRERYCRLKVAGGAAPGSAVR